MGLGGLSRIVRGLAALAGAGLLAGLATPVLAQTAPSSVKIGTASFLSPTEANSIYGTNVTATYSLGATYTRPNEIKELARALNNNVDQIYDYVRNNVEITWVYGLSKGPVGALVDKSGTAFDQANLMVELLREAGYTAGYRAGYITLTGAQFEAWSGITDAKAACQLLSSGGIPGIINNTTLADCSYTGSITTIKVSHIWVSVVIGGTTYLFDPAYKPSTQIAGINLTTAAGMTSGEALTQAGSGSTTGQESGVDYVKNLNTEQLEAKLATYAAGIQAAIDAAPVGDMDNIVGGQEIVRYETPTGGLRQTALPYTATQQKVWSGRIPNQYRASLRVEITKMRETGMVTIIDKTLYADELGGRKLIFNTVYDSNPDLNSTVNFDAKLQVVDEFQNATTVASLVFSSNFMVENPVMSYGDVKLSVNAPYAARAPGSTTDGTYMDTVKVSPVSYHLSFTIVNSWGATSPAMVAKWGSRKDRTVPITPLPEVVGVQPHDRCDNCLSPFVSTAGDGKREQLAIGWMAQSYRAGDLQARMAGSIYQHHYSIGLVAADTQIRVGESGYDGSSSTPPWEQPGYSRFFFTIDSADRIDVDTSFSLTSRTANANERRPAVHAIAASIAALEGSISAQQVDMPDTSSVATRFAWGNRPPSAEDPSGSFGPRKFYEFTSANASAASSLVKVEGLTSTTADGEHSGQTVEIGSTELGNRRTALANSISAYTSAGFTVVSSEEAFLGPGQRQGGMFVPEPIAFPSIYKHKESKQRGGAFVATKYVGGEPVEIAFVVVGPDASAKGGGAGAQLFNQAQYDPATAADVLKSRFVDRSTVLGVDLKTGKVTQTSPASLSVGTGEFPYKLEAQLIWQGGRQPDPVFNATNDIAPGGPWITNWSNSLSLSGSGMEAMGVTDPRATADTLAAFLAMRDIYAATPSEQREAAGALVNAWWARRMNGNVVTVTVGADSRQFLRRANNQWLSPGATVPSTLTMTGSRVVVAELPGCDTGLVTVVGTRGYDDASLGFTVTGPGGDVQTWVYWRTDVPDGQSCTSKVKGFRLSSWTFPQGVTVNLTYQNYNTLNGEMPALLSVSNNLGRQINFTRSGLEGFNDSTRSVTFTANSFVNPTLFTHTDAVGAVSKFEVTQVADEYRLLKQYAPDNATTAAVEYTYDSLGRVKEVKDAIALQVGGRAPYQFLVADGVRGERIDPQTPTAGRYVVMYDRDGRPMRVIDEIGRKTELTHDARGRVTSYTYPEGNKEVMSYDLLNRLTAITNAAKPGSGLSDTTISATYEPQWNKLASITDPLGNTTEFTYVSSGDGKSLMALAKRPDPDGPGAKSRPEYKYTYNAVGQTLTTEDPTSLVVQSSYTNGYLTSITVDPGGVNAVTTMTYNTQGDVLTVDGARTDVSDVSYTTYDANRRKIYEIGPDPDGTGALLRPVTRTTYDLKGQIVQVDKGRGATTDGSDFAALQTMTSVYDPVGNKIRVNSQAGVTQFSYDQVNRQLCAAIRMNATAYASLPADACTLGPQGSDGPDRITKTTYDLAGQLLTTVRGYGSPEQQTYASYTYSPNGMQLTITDARGNRSAMQYDGFDRFCRLSFPVSTVGVNQSSPVSRALCSTDPTLTNPDTATTGDFEETRYDAAGRKTWFRRRDGQVVYFEYDALGREIKKNLPSTTALDVYTDYDAAGRITDLRYGSLTGGGIVLGYDGAKRRSSEETFGKAMTYEYDLAGNRTRVTWFDGQYAQYSYNAAGQLTMIGENGATSGAGVLATFTYDDLGRRTGLSRGANLATTTYSYDSADRLTALNQNPSGTSFDQSWTYSWNPASQVLTRGSTNTAYKWATPTPGTESKTFDGLNRDAAVVTAGGYDLRGNLTADGGGRTFVYDVENRLITVGGTVDMTLSYDPIGRLAQTVSGGTTNNFLYDSDRLSAEYNTSGIIVRRYVHGPGVDEPLVWYEGSTLGDPRWLHHDAQGSVVAYSTGTGSVNAANVYKYGPWGEPDDNWAAGASRFRYTGQIALPEVRLYYYKARMYDPAFGRFLQTDPIGYSDDLNLYAYVAGDPINSKDPSGTQTLQCRTTERGTIVCEGRQNIIEAAGTYVAAGVWNLGVGIYNALTSDEDEDDDKDEGKKDKKDIPAADRRVSRGDNGEPPPPDPLTPVVGGMVFADHAEQRRAEARAGDDHRQLGDWQRVIREGRSFYDTETGNMVYVSGDRAVVIDPRVEGTTRVITGFRNTRANTEARIRSGRWVPMQR